jgi:hypothetical protein
MTLKKCDKQDKKRIIDKDKKSDMHWDDIHEVECATILCEISAIFTT